MIGSKREFDELVQFINQQGCKTELHVRDAVNIYFSRITWSILKEEYDKLTKDEKEILVLKLYQGERRKRGMGSN